MLRISLASQIVTALVAVIFLLNGAVAPAANQVGANIGVGLLVVMFLIQLVVGVIALIVSRRKKH